MDKFKFGWIIEILEKTEDGLQIELADLGNGKHMIVATDTLYPIKKDTYRQAGYGPFVLDPSLLAQPIKMLKEHLLDMRKGTFLI